MSFSGFDFLAGCIGGAAGTLVGHPFDTVKARLQTQSASRPRYRGTGHCFVRIVREESVLGLFKGLAPPMGGLAVINAVVFGVYGNVIRNVDDPGSLGNQFLAGAVAGLSQSIIAGPMELVKLRMQLQSAGVAPRDRDGGTIVYRNTLDCFRRVCRSDGPIGVFRGLGLTIVREVPGFGVYFASYELLIGAMSPTNGADSGSLTAGAGKLLLAGGLAGCLSWLSTFPADVIKSRIQADGMAGTRGYTSAWDCAVKSYRAEGVAAFFRGVNSAMIRAFPMNAVTFATVVLLNRLRDGEDGGSDGHRPATTDMMIISPSSSDLCIRSTSPDQPTHTRQDQRSRS